MKEIVFSLFLFVSLTSNAQIFTHKKVVDKFDDVIEDKELKTIVHKTDTTFSIEEKGKAPDEYIIILFAEENSKGNKDNIVHLFENVYGYQECWGVVRKEDLNNYYLAYTSYILETDEDKKNMALHSMVDKYCYYLIHRVVTTQYTHQFLFETFWIQKNVDTDRTIYFNQ